MKKCRPSRSLLILLYTVSVYLLINHKFVFYINIPLFYFLEEKWGFFFHLYIWLHCVLVVECWIFNCSMQNLQLQHVRSSSLGRELNLGLLHWECRVLATGPLFLNLTARTLRRVSKYQSARHALPLPNQKYQHGFFHPPYSCAKIDKNAPYLCG